MASSSSSSSSSNLTSIMSPKNNKFICSFKGITKIFPVEPTGDKFTIVIRTLSKKQITTMEITPTNNSAINSISITPNNAKTNVLNCSFNGITNSFPVNSTGIKLTIVIQTNPMTTMEFTETTIPITKTPPAPKHPKHPKILTKKGVAYILFEKKVVKNYQEIVFYFDYPEGNSVAKAVSWEDYYGKIREDIIEQVNDEVPPESIQLMSLNVDYCEKPLSASNLHNCDFERVALLPPLSFPIFEEQPDFIRVSYGGKLIKKNIYFNNKTTFGELVYRLCIALGCAPNHFQLFYNQRTIMKGYLRHSHSNKKRKVEEFVTEQQHLLDFACSSLFVETFQKQFKETPSSTQIYDQFFVNNIL